MTKMHRLRIVCFNILRVIAFYAAMMWWFFQLDPMLSELYVNTPFVVFVCVSLFLMLFLCRETGCLVFMDKSRLKGILRAGEPEPTTSKIVLNLFSWPFLKRICMFLGLFVLEFYLRLFLIKLFLITIQHTLSFWEKVTNFSEGLLYVLFLLTSYVIMELPAWLTFYKLSFKGRSNRSYEYRFGLKLSVLTALIIGLRLAAISLTAEASSAVDVLAFILFAGASFGLWYLMYRKKFCCMAGGCPICNTVKAFFGKKEKTDAPSVEILPKENE